MRNTQNSAPRRPIEMSFALPLMDAGETFTRRPVNDAKTLRNDLSHISADGLKATVKFIQKMIKGFEKSANEKTT